MIIEAFQLVQYAAVTVGNLYLEELIQFNRLLQTEEMLGTIISQRCSIEGTVPSTSGYC
ncbi:MAG: hypothetical protein A4E57_02056 [Syntrophorhabdaceae bacterium PtaU1.Bin034]|jgi:hypothetical protein|nr:MAG: hypothetical protein A4E57_02056 [Syntrophorhabdaceae bacterium PtaU1.Bin034]